MLRSLLVSVLILAASAAAAEPLPELRTEPIGGGSIFHVHNPGSQPLTGFLIELVNYPGSYYALWQDDLAAPLPAGADKQIHVTNMTVGAVPDYVKITAAVYADGSSAGAAEKVTMFVERRRAVLATTRELISRLEKPQSKPDLIASLKQWAETLQPPGRNTRTQAAVNQIASRSLVLETASHIESGTREPAMAALRASEKLLAASKPTL